MFSKTLSDSRNKQWSFQSQTQKW